MISQRQFISYLWVSQGDLGTEMCCSHPSQEESGCRLGAGQRGLGTMEPPDHSIPPHTTHHIWADKYGYSLLMWGSVKTPIAMFFSVEFITQHEKRILVCLPLAPACLITATKESRNVTLVTINSWRKARALYYLCINLRYTGSRSSAGLPMVRII